MTDDVLTKYKKEIENLPRVMPQAFSPDDKALDEKIIALIHGSGGVVLEDMMVKSIWQRLCESSGGFDPEHKVAISDLPKEWPRLKSGKQIVFNIVEYSKVEHFVRHQSDNPYFDHGVKDLDYDFFIPYGSQEFPREKVFRAIEAFGLTEKAIYSRPASDYNMVPMFSVQDSNPTIEQRTIEQENDTISDKDRYGHDDNFLRLLPFMRNCKVSVVLENFCFDENYSGRLSEKIMYPISAGVPWILAGNKYQRETLIRRGFRPHHKLAETGKEFIEQMLWLKAMFRDPAMTRRWHQEQGEIIIHNQNQLKKLKNIVVEESSF